MIADSVAMLAVAAQRGRDVTTMVWVHMHVVGGKLCDRKSVTAKTDEQAQLASHLPRVLCTNCARIYCEVTSGNILQTQMTQAPYKMSKKANANEGRRMRITRPQLGCLIHTTANGRTEGRGAVECSRHKSSKSCQHDVRGRCKRRAVTVGGAAAYLRWCVTCDV
jgi:hypothetical protein